DAAVKELWSPTGLSRPVNRATSLRNLIKMMLVAEGLLHTSNTSQEKIAQLDKTPLVKTAAQLFGRFIDSGFLLLNGSLVFRPGRVREDASVWRPFIQNVLAFVVKHRPHTQLVLFGNIAKNLGTITQQFDCLVAEHPYNLSFISNPAVLNFFRPLSLLK